MTVAPFRKIGVTKQQIQYDRTKKRQFRLQWCHLQVQEWGTMPSAISWMHWEWRYYEWWMRTTSYLESPGFCSLHNWASLTRSLTFSLSLTAMPVYNCWWTISILLTWIPSAVTSWIVITLKAICMWWAGIKAQMGWGRRRSRRTRRLLSRHRLLATSRSSTRAPTSSRTATSSRIAGGRSRTRDWFTRFLTVSGSSKPAMRKMYRFPQLATRSPLKGPFNRVTVQIADHPLSG